LFFLLLYLLQISVFKQQLSFAPKLNHLSL
jgi:hypothetical protein